MKNTRIIGALIALILGGAMQLVAAADLIVKTTAKEPPGDVSDALKKSLQPTAIQAVAEGKPIYEFWFRKDIPLKAKPESAAKGLDALNEITFLGVVNVGEGRRDYKDNEIAPGVYTMRFGLQPQDGDHLGTSEFPYFAVLIPAKSDTELEGIRTFKAMVKASSKGTASGHPIVLSLRPPAAPATDQPTLTKPAADHQAVRLKLPAKAGDQAESLSFELVVEGKFKS